MWVKTALFAVATLACLANSEKIFLSQHWSADDSKRLGESFQHTIAHKEDLASIHYAVSGLRLLGQKVDDVKNKALCALAQKADLKDVEALYHAASIAGDINACTLTAPAAKETVDAVAKEAGVSAERLFEALTIADRLNVKADQAAFDKAITAAITKDPSAKSLASGVAAASLLDKATGAKYFAKIGALVEQADEIGGKYLQLDGGLSVTATAVYGIFQLSDKQGKAPTITKDQVLLFTNYLLSRRQVFADRAAYNVVRAIGVLINNNYFVPASVAIESAPDAAKTLRLRVSNVFGLPLSTGSIVVKADRVTQGDVVVEKAKTATKVAGDSTNTHFDLTLAETKAPGHYKLHVVLEGINKNVIGTTGIEFDLKTTQEATVEGLKVAFFEKDSSVAVKEQSIAAFAKAPTAVTPDYNGRIIVKFAVKSKADNKNILPHQNFVSFEHVATGNEIIYVADKQKDNSYKLEANLATEGAQFDGHSGAYRMRIVIGDALITTPLNWVFADATLTVPAAPVEIVRKSEKISYDVLPTIQHQFREPEKRPSGVVSDAFTILCLVPLVVLFALWFRMGANVSDMPLSIYVVLFHAGLTALFGLYFVFWLRLNMFETLKYIAAIGGVTFIAGHRLLRTLAERRKSKTA